jgi:delta1-piperideine-2-carboxylate reductase
VTFVSLSLDDVYALGETCLLHNGCDPANAAAVATTMAVADRDGCASHGLFRLPGYVASLRSGKVNGAAQPHVERTAPGVIRVDGDGGFSPLGLEAGRAPLIEAARSQGVAVMALVRSYHFAALWPEIEPLCDAGLVAMACTAYMPVVAPAGAKEAFFGTNPLAFGFPRADGPPMVFDQASAAMARGEIQIAARDGRAIPEGAGLDVDGNPTGDPAAVLEGVQLPFGGYKGSAIALMVELLAAGLIGEWFSYEAAQHDNHDGGPAMGGEFLLAIDPARTGGDPTLAHSDAFFTAMLGLEGVRLPGDRRHAARLRTAIDGVSIPASLYEEITSLGGRRT